VKPIRTYSVTVEGYAPVLFSARSPSKARWLAYQAYTEAFDCSFTRFLALLGSVRQVDNPPGIGARFLVCGRPATRVLGRSPEGLYFMRDDSDVIMVAHPSEIAPLPNAA